MLFRSLTNKVIKTFKDIFNLFSVDEKMNKIQCAQFMSSIMKEEVKENNKRIKN